LDVSLGRGTHIYKRTNYIYEGQWEHDERCYYGILSAPSRTPSLDSKKDSKSTDSLVKEILSSSTKKPNTKNFKELEPGYRKLYAGDWKHDVRCGVGTSYYPDGARYEGEWQDNVRCGWGTMYYADGSRYDGEWRDDMRHGQGILLLPNFDRYEGIFVHDKKEGPGKFFFKQKKQIYEGEWSEDMPKCGALRDMHPRSPTRSPARSTIELPANKLPVVRIFSPPFCSTCNCIS
jgi:hypothetical protein